MPPCLEYVSCATHSARFITLNTAFTVTYLLRNFPRLSSSVNSSAWTMRPSTIYLCLLPPPSHILPFSPCPGASLPKWDTFIPHPTVGRAFFQSSTFLLFPYHQKSSLSLANPTYPKTQFKPHLFQDAFIDSSTTFISIHTTTVYSISARDVRTNDGLWLLVSVFSGSLEE